MQVIYERCAAVDVGKDVIVIAVRGPGKGPDGRVTVKRQYKTFYGVLREASRWLMSEGVTHVAMEATGIYSMPVYHALIEHGDFEKVLVCNAGHVKNVPGRKTDMADAEWLCQLLECGLLAGSFIPPADVKAARDVIRYRAKIAQQRVSEIARLANVLQDAGIKLDSVASSIATKSGRLMIEALIDGERRGAVLADLAIGRMRPKIPDLSMALEGRFQEHHAMLCRLHLDHLDHLDGMLKWLGRLELAPPWRPDAAPPGVRPERRISCVGLKWPHPGGCNAAFAVLAVVLGGDRRGSYEGAAVRPDQAGLVARGSVREGPGSQVPRAPPAGPGSADACRAVAAQDAGTEVSAAGAAEGDHRRVAAGRSRRRALPRILTDRVAPAQCRPFSPGRPRPQHQHRTGWGHFKPSQIRETGTRWGHFKPTWWSRMKPS